MLPLQKPGTSGVPGPLLPQHCLSPPRVPRLHAAGVYVHPVNPAMQPFQEMLVGGGAGKFSPGLEFEGLITTAWHTAAQPYGTCP